MTTLATAIADLNDELVRDRRHFHSHPELAFEEHETAAYVAERLRTLGIDVRTGVGKTGVVGVIWGSKAGKTVLLRADMDALPILEQSSQPYASQNTGVMHACGHDGHTSILLAVARVLAGRKANLTGNVVLVFQPSEEKPPGGALAMIADGAMDDPKVDASFGLHLSMDPVGTVSVCSGPAMAAADMVTATILGSGGHASRPHTTIDPVLIAANVVTTLHTIVSREVDPLQPAVITIGAIQAGTVGNVIPDTAVMRGSIRTFDQALRERLAKRIEATIVGIARAMGGDADVQYEFGYPVLVNDEAMTDLVRKVGHEVVGPDKTLEGQPILGSEDVGYFLERAAGCYFRLGIANKERGLTHSNHTARYDIDEAALPIGVEMLVRVAETYLGA
jgi:amidohydrolase